MNYRICLSISLISYFLLSCALSFSQTVVSKMDLTKGMSALSDKPIAGFQLELLDLAFEVATDIPIVPHIKDRSRSQEKIVEIALKLDQPQKALQYIEKIDDWRRGSGYGDLALYHVINGQKDVEKYITLAKQIAEAAEDWRRDTIKVKIAKIYTLLGDEEAARSFEDNLVDSEKGKVAGHKAKIAAKDEFNTQFKDLEILIKTENFDIIKNALESYTELYNRFYQKKNYRDRVEKKIKTSWEKMPIIIRIELLSRLAQIALEHDDKAKAVKLVGDARVIIDEHQWALEFYLPMIANLSKLRFNAGQTQEAVADAESVLAKFHADKETIVDIYRAQALSPLAEAFLVMGNTAQSLEVYRIALEESVVNPNSRPRAEDMAAILSSMANYSVEPDEKLWERIRQIKGGLGNPW